MIPGSPKPAAAAEAVVVTRPGFDPEPHPVSRGAAFLIKELKDNKTLGDALETATQDPDFDFGTTLGQLLAGGAIIDVRTDT